MTVDCVMVDKHSVLQDSTPVVADTSAPVSHDHQYGPVSKDIASQTRSLRTDVNEPPDESALDEPPPDDPPDEPPASSSTAHGVVYSVQYSLKLMSVLQA